VSEVISRQVRGSRLPSVYSFMRRPRRLADRHLFVLRPLLGRPVPIGGNPRRARRSSRAGPRTIVVRKSQV